MAGNICNMSYLNIDVMRYFEPIQNDPPGLVLSVEERFSFPERRTPFAKNNTRSIQSGPGGSNKKLVHKFKLIY